MLLVIRHGATELNEGNARGERTRGWLPVPLTLEGMQQMITTADSLSDVKDVKALYSSDLVRSVQSAEEIAHVLGMVVEPREDLRDWNVGQYAGQEIEKILKDLHGYMDDADTPIPGGEAYQSFLNRAVPFLKDLVESDDLYIAVTHNRVITLLKALSVNDGEYPDTTILKNKAPINPGGIMIIRADWKIAYQST